MRTITNTNMCSLQETSVQTSDQKATVLFLVAADPKSRDIVYQGSS